LSSAPAAGAPETYPREPPRRGAGRCKWCLSGDGIIEPPDDSDRRYWLERLSDEEIAEAALCMFGHRPDRAHIGSERERLLGAVVRFGAPVTRGKLSL
jgi:hypothetical protein